MSRKKKDNDALPPELAALRAKIVVEREAVWARMAEQERQHHARLLEGIARRKAALKDVSDLV